MRSRGAVLTDKPLTELSRDDIIEFSKKREEPEWVLRRRLEAYEYLRSTPPDPRIDPLMERVTYKTFIESLENPVLPTEEAIRAAERLGVKPEELEVLASGFSIDVDNRLVLVWMRL